MHVHDNPENKFTGKRTNNDTHTHSQTHTHTHTHTYTPMAASKGDIARFLGGADGSETGPAPWDPLSQHSSNTSSNKAPRNRRPMQQQQQQQHQSGRSASRNDIHANIQSTCGTISKDGSSAGSNASINGTSWKHPSSKEVVHAAKDKPNKCDARYALRKSTILNLKVNHDVLTISGLQEQQNRCGEPATLKNDLQASSPRSKNDLSEGTREAPGEREQFSQDRTAEESAGIEDDVGEDVHQEARIDEACHAVGDEVTRDEVSRQQYQTGNESIRGEQSCGNPDENGGGGLKFAVHVTENEHGCVKDARPGTPIAVNDSRHHARHFSQPGINASDVFEKIMNKDEAASRAQTNKSDEDVPSVDQYHDKEDKYLAQMETVATIFREVLSPHASSSKSALQMPGSDTALRCQKSAKNMYAPGHYVHTHNLSSEIQNLSNKEKDKDKDKDSSRDMASSHMLNKAHKLGGIRSPPKSLYNHVLGVPTSELTKNIQELRTISDDLRNNPAGVAVQNAAYPAHFGRAYSSNLECLGGGSDMQHRLNILSGFASHNTKFPELIPPKLQPLDAGDKWAHNVSGKAACNNEQTRWPRPQLQHGAGQMSDNRVNNAVQDNRAAGRSFSAPAMSNRRTGFLPSLPHRGVKEAPVCGSRDAVLALLERVPSDGQVGDVTRLNRAQRDPKSNKLTPLGRARADFPEENTGTGVGSLDVEKLEGKSTTVLWCGGRMHVPVHMQTLEMPDFAEAPGQRENHSSEKKSKVRDVRDKRAEGKDKMKHMRGRV
jgi:hypothetical protein